MFPQTTKRRALLMLNLILAIAVLCPTWAHADERAPKGADIVFLIDQSGSMQDSDPLGLRFEGLQFALEWLGRTLLEYDPEHQFSFRVAVVDFGTYPRQALEPVEIAPKSEENWQDVRAFLEKRLAEENRPGLGTTEMVKALEEAARIYAAWGSPSPERQRVVILLTDGLPYPDSEQAMANVERYYNANFPFPTYQLYVVGLSSPESPWPLFAARWDRLSRGRAQPVENRRLLGTHFQRILGEVGQSLGIQAEQTAQCGMISVAPYLDLVRFTVHNPDPTASVKVYDAANQLVNGAETDGISQIGDEVVEVRGRRSPIEAITVYNPQPGYWRLECPFSGESQPVIFVRQVPARSQVEMPGQRLALGVPYAITFRLFDHFGKPLAQDKDPRFALDVRLSAMATGQMNVTPEDVVLHYDSATKAFRGVFKPIVAGEWTHRLTARTAAPDGKEHVVADITTVSVQVSRAQTKLSLPSGSLEQLVPITLTVAMADSEGRPFVKTTEILSALSAQAVVVEGSQTITVPLQPSESGLYVGSFVPYSEGDHSAQGRIYLSDPTQPKPVLVAEGQRVSFRVQPVKFESRFEPTRLTQLVPAIVYLNLQTAQRYGLQAFRDLSLWKAEIRGLGSQNVEITRSVLENNEIALTLTPKSAGEFQPELTLTLQRPKMPGSAGTVRQALGNVNISAPLVITQTLNQKTEPGRACGFSVMLLDATGQPFVKTMDSSYTLSLTAYDSAAPDAPPISFVRGSNGFYVSTTSPKGGRTYLLRAEAIRGNETVKLVDGIILSSSGCGIIPPIDGRDPVLWIVIIAAALVLLVLMILGVRWWLRRRSRPEEGVENPDAKGYIVLEYPKGTPRAEKEIRRTVEVWEPGITQIIDESDKKVICPVRQIEIRQSIPESRGETHGGKVGAHVRVIYVDGFDAFNGRQWVDARLELKDHWWIAFSERPQVGTSSVLGASQAQTRESSSEAPSAQPESKPTSPFNKRPSLPKPETDDLVSQ